VSGSSFSPGIPRSADFLLPPIYRLHVELWLVRDVPAWIVGLVLFVGVPAALLALDTLLHRHLPHQRLRRHNDVTGVMVSVVGVAYAIVIGLCVVSLWEGYSDAETTVREEAANLTALVPAAAVYGPSVQAAITDDIVRYHSDIVADWKAPAGAGTGRDARASLDRLVTAVGALRPATPAEQDFVRSALSTIGHAEQLRQQAEIEGEDRQMSPVMWIGVIATTIVFLGLCLFFGVEDNSLRRLLLALVGVVIATNLFLIVEMNYPHYGTFSVGPDAYEAVVENLRSSN
jgi:hypothetical protein